MRIEDIVSPTAAPIDGKILALLEDVITSKFDPDQARDENGRWTAAGEVALVYGGGSFYERFPDESEDSAPGKDFFYHATPSLRLHSIANSGLRPPGGDRPVSLAPHLNSVVHWAQNVGDDGDQNVLLRVRRDRVEAQYADDDYAPYDASDDTAELATFRAIPPEDIEVYHRGRWKNLKQSVGGVAKKAFDPDQARDENGRWTSGAGGGRSRGKAFTPRATKPDIHPMEWVGQMSQFPEKGPPGLSYFKGEIDDERHVDSLLFRDDEGTLRGILYRYPFDFPPYEKKGNVNVLVDPLRQRRGIGTKLWREAEKRWGINQRQQDYTPAGAKFIARMNQAKPAKVSWADIRGSIFEPSGKFDPDQPRDEGGRWTDDGASGGQYGPEKPVRVPGAARVVDEKTSSSSRFAIVREMDKLISDNGRNLEDHKVRVEAKQRSNAAVATKFEELYPELSRQIPFYVIEEHAREYIDGWAETSGDHNASAVAYQIAARAEFGLSGAQFDHLGKVEDVAMEILGRPATPDDDGPLNVDVYRALLRSTYEATQDLLRDAGIKSVPLIRGATYEDPNGRPVVVDRNADLNLQPLSSFSTDINSAQKFSGWLGEYGGHLHLMHVPADRVFSTPWSGIGCLPESEVVVLGGMYSGAKTISVEIEHAATKEMVAKDPAILFSSESPKYKRSPKTLTDVEIYRKVAAWMNDEAL